MMKLTDLEGIIPLNIYNQMREQIYDDTQVLSLADLAYKWLLLSPSTFRDTVGQLLEIALTNATPTDVIKLAAAAMEVLDNIDNAVQKDVLL